MRQLLSTCCAVISAALCLVLILVLILSVPSVQGYFLFSVEKNTCDEYKVKARWMMDLLDGLLFDKFDLAGSIQSYTLDSDSSVRRWKGNSQAFLRMRYQVRWYGRRVPPDAFVIYPQKSLWRPSNCP
jgi:hypothetical protein